MSLNLLESIRNFISNLQTKPFTVNNSKLSLKSPPDKVKHKTFTSSPYSGKTPSSAYRTPNDIQYTNNEDLTSTNSTITTTTESSHVHITHYEDGSSQFDIPESSQDREPLHVQRPNTITTSTERPQSSATVARRMISHALGVQIKPSPEQREKETRLLREAKGIYVCLLAYTYSLSFSFIFSRKKTTEKGFENDFVIIIFQYKFHFISKIIISYI